MSIQCLDEIGDIEVLKNRGILSSTRLRLGEILPFLNCGLDTNYNALHWYLQVCTEQIVANADDSDKITR